MSELRRLSNRDLEALRREVVRRGWRVMITGGNHVKWLHHSGAFAYSAQTPGDFRTVRKLRAMLRRIERQAVAP